MATHFIIVIMALILGIIITQIRLKYKFLSKGKTVIGSVVDVLYTTKKNAKITIPVIQFVANDSLTITQKSEESIISSRVKKGTKVKVFYDPQNPEVFLAQGMQFKMLTLTILITSCIFVIGGFILILNDLKFIHLFK